MPVKLSPPPRQQYMDANGDPAVGCKLFAYAAGSSTKQSTFTDNTGFTANTNPIILDASGRTPFGLWLETGLAYKFVLAPATDTDPPTSPIFTEDLVMGINDITTPAALAASSQWVASGVTPTYVNATQFTLVGDQRAAFHVGRRLRLTVTAGTVYGEISVSAFTTLTTVTVVLDSGALDAGLSAVDVGILTAQNNSMPEPSSVGYQPLDTLLTNLAAQTTAANRIQGYSGADTPSLYTVGNAVGNIPAVAATSTASETVAGLVEKATSVEASAGTADKYPDAELVKTVSVPAAMNASGSAPMYACRAWVNFNGTGTVAIRAAGNVSSITDNGVGDYTVNFTTPLADANYSAVLTADVSGGGVAPVAMTRDDTTPRTPSSIRISIRDNTGSAIDSTAIAILVSR